MIDIENEVFNIVAQAVHQQYPDVFLSGEYVKSPSSFPCISLSMLENSVCSQSARQTERSISGIRADFESAA